LLEFYSLGNNSRYSSMLSSFLLVERDEENARGIEESRKEIHSMAITVIADRAMSLRNIRIIYTIGSEDIF